MDKEKTFEKYKIDRICMLIKIVNSKTYSYKFINERIHKKVLDLE